jgi:putative oxidoreductase
MTTTTISATRPTTAAATTAGPTATTIGSARSAQTRDAVIAAFRVVVAFLFFLHAIMAFGALGGMDGAGAAAPVGSFPWCVGAVQAAGAILIAVGLWTRQAAFLLSGIMAGAYFMVHQPMGALPMQNMGEQAALYSWIFLVLVAIGPGRYAVDALRRRG